VWSCARRQLHNYFLDEWFDTRPAGRAAEVVGSAIDGASQDLGSMTAPALSADPDMDATGRTRFDRVRGAHLRSTCALSVGGLNGAQGEELGWEYERRTARHRWGGTAVRGFGWSKAPVGAVGASPRSIE
jgi:hypothetical protein